MAPPIRRVALVVLKVAISAALIAFAMRGVDTASVAAVMGRARAGPLVLALAMFTSIATLHARRWGLVLQRLEHAISYAQALRLILVGYFFNQTLPSTIGGDAYRAWGVYKHGVRAGNAIASVVVDRALALVSLVAMITATTWWLFDIVSAPMPRAAVVAACAGGLGGFALLLALPRFAPSLLRWRLTRLLLHVAEGARAIVARPALAAEFFALTIAGYVVMSYVVYVLAADIGVDLSIGNAVILMPLVTLVSIVPISIAGWGVRESAMVVALGLVGVAASHAFALSVLFGLVTMASGIPGGLLWLLARRRAARP
jgi:uncharacterized membrane protein YbhN (UPF0104 family)